MLPWFLLVMFLHLPFTIWLSLMLAGVAVSDGGLSVMQASVSVLQGDRSLCIQRYVGTPARSTLLWLYLGMQLCGPDQLWVQWKSEDSCPRLLLGSCVLRFSGCFL